MQILFYHIHIQSSHSFADETTLFDGFRREAQ